MTTIQIKTATGTDAHQAIAPIMLAFSTDPVLRWCYPDPHQFLSHFPSFARVYGGRAFEQGSAYYIDGFSGAALWLPPGIDPDGEEMANVFQSTLSGRLREEVFSVLEQMDSYHPSESCWYLPLIGVETRQQNQGIGSTLMKHALIPCDRDQKVAYLEATNPESIRFYERHGFESLGTIQAGSSPPMFPMLRKPR